MKKLLILTCGIFLFTSCKKEKTKTRTDLLCQHVWKYSAVTVGGNDAGSLVPACIRDNTIKFNKDGRGTIAEGATKCNPADPDTYSITWSFLSGETQLRILPPLLPGSSDTYTIVSLTDTQLVISQSMTLPPPFGAQNVVITLTR